MCEETQYIEIIFHNYEIKKVTYEYQLKYFNLKTPSKIDQKYQEEFGLTLVTA